MSLRIDRSRRDQAKVRFGWAQQQPAGTVSVVGTFNDWTPGMDELVEDSHGERTVTLGLPYGQRFVFRYLADNGQWFDDPDADEIIRSGSVIHAITAPTDGGSDELAD